MKVIIVEDEPAGQQFLARILKENFPELKLMCIADNVPDAVRLIRECRPDIVYLDVEIKMGSGLDVLAQTEDIAFDVIFTTVFNSFALDAFRYHAIDYLLKPLSKAQVTAATQRFLSGSAAMNREKIASLMLLMQQAAAQRPKICIPTVEGVELVNVADIVYGSAKGNYTEIWMSNGSKILSGRKIKEVEDELPRHIFFRIHHSYLVNLNYVTRYQKGRGGSVLLYNGYELPVASNRKEDFLTWLRKGVSF
ncbi:LytR/AlgR family response regulator transcription factor [Chitinophaga solisilvae]|uniref:LytR/AlgR family response regulator transcription factor n=1 Tax=Chitinophaga solisilvae TaxID=1233460 RepID=UPI00136D3624|nr:LytTR family DNA-binding domain-containing protein [Chitinophaga solisilvae]